MTRFAPILAAIASPVMADPAAQWGGSSALLHPCRAADACVTVHNELSATPDIVAVILDYHGFAVELIVVMGDGAEPDRATLRAPVGWLVMPKWADVPEGGAVTFQLFAPMVG